MALVRFGQIRNDNLREPRPAISSLTDETGGTTNGVLEIIDGGLSKVSTACNNNFAEINTKLNEIISALRKCNWVTGT